MSSQLLVVSNHL